MSAFNASNTGDDPPLEDTGRTAKISPITWGSFCGTTLKDDNLTCVREAVSQGRQGLNNNAKPEVKNNAKPEVKTRFSLSVTFDGIPIVKLV